MGVCTTEPIRPYRPRSDVAVVETERKQETSKTFIVMSSLPPSPHSKGLSTTERKETQFCIISPTVVDADDNEGRGERENYTQDPNEKEREAISKTVI